MGFFIRDKAGFFFVSQISFWTKKGHVLTSESDQPQKNVVNLYRSTIPRPILTPNVSYRPGPPTPAVSYNQLLINSTNSQVIFIPQKTTLLNIGGGGI